MVGSTQLFVVDATFLLKKTTEAFHGAPLLVANGQDNTFTYGLVRDLLRLRQGLGIADGILVAGKESRGAATDAEVKAVVAFVKEMGIPVMDRPERSVLDICFHLASIATHLVSDDAKLVQLSKERLSVIKPKTLDEYECLTPKAVLTTVGVSTSQIPTFLALHKPGERGGKPGQFTKRQAIRLIELYGNLEAIYSNLEAIKTASIRDKLAADRQTIQRRYFASTIDSSPLDVTLNLSQLGWNLENKRVAELLDTHRFHSLVSRLALPDCARPPAAVEVGEQHAYKLVQDRETLRQLETVVRSSQLCALDTESDDKDPRTASLLGVALSVQEGEAFFVPMLDRDLKGVSSAEVVSTLKRMLTKECRIVGHNIKYDALLLNRHGVAIKNLYFDTMLAAYDCYGDWDFFNLGFLAERLLKIRIKRYGDVVQRDQTFLDLPLKEMKDHGCQDADFARRLYATLDKELNKRSIRGQYTNTTLKLTKRLVRHEAAGVPVYLNKLENLRVDLLENISDVKNKVETNLGKKLDLDSTKDVTTAVKDHLGLGSTFGEKSLSVRRLEELAILYRDIRPIVEYRRLRKQLKRVESVAAVARNTRIYPLFNQVRFSSGRLSSSTPNLFGEDGLDPLAACIGKTIRDLLPNLREALDRLGSVSKDENLQSDRRSGNGNAFMIKHQVMSQVQHDEFLLNFVCGISGPAMSRRFMLERRMIDSACHDLRIRYRRLSAWAVTLRVEAGKCGYVVGPKGRKYLDGLRSSSIDKRKKAADSAVRWMIDF